MRDMNRTSKQSKRQFRKPKKSRLGVWAVMAVAILLGAYLGVLELSRPHVSGDKLRFDTFVKLVNQGRVQTARILDEDAYVVGTYVPDQSGTPEQAPLGLSLSHGAMGGGLDATAVGEPAEGRANSPAVPYNVPLLRGTQSELLDVLLKNGVPITVDQQVGKRIVALASVLLPGLILVVLFLYLILSYRRGTGLFGIRSGAHRIDGQDIKVGFDDVAGQEAAVTELREIIQFLTDPERFAALGAAVPKGILLYGPPGCGKTLLAKALAAEAGAAFYSISGSDFVELYVGVGAARVRDLFREARENAPAILFIDELDSIGRARGAAAAVASHGEQEQGLNQILAEMDGFSPSDGIIVVAATNRPDVLDQALLRPGRFDRTIGLERPDEVARLAILSVHARNKPLDPAVELSAIARLAIGMTGADLAAVMNEAALLAARAQKPVISQLELERALQQILQAPERQRRLALRQRSVAKRFAADERATFADVAGADDAIAELVEVREYLADPERFAAMGARVPRGILLAGPPGCGKTLLARAVAGEANAAFFSAAASEFVQVFAGEGAARVRDMFAEARSLAPAIVFLDEIDAIGARRGVVLDGHREQEQTLNQILVELDGFEARTGVIVMAATNRPDILDPALVRAGRFDRRVEITLPDRSGRRAILALYAKAKPLGREVDLDVVAGLSPGFSGADLANVLNEAALLATRRRLKEIPMSVMEEAIDRAFLGVASRGTILSEQERRLVAYHEAGHALVARALPGAVSPHKLSIVSRGGILGSCAMLEPYDTVVRSRSFFRDQIAMLLAGRAAEELLYGDPGSGAATDLARAGAIARRMVCELGMSDVGLLPYAYAENGRQDDSFPRYSQEAIRTIEAEVQRLMDEEYRRAWAMLAETRELLDRVAEALFEREALLGTEIEELASALVHPSGVSST